MTLDLRWVTIDTPTPQQLAPFWERLLEWERHPDIDDDSAVALVDPARGTDEPGLLLFHSDDPKRVKNRVHLDLVPRDRTTAAWKDEIDRALALGAQHADIGQQGREPWTVLVDPEGNEFCILQPPEHP